MPGREKIHKRFLQKSKIPPQSYRWKIQSEGIMLSNQFGIKQFSIAL